MTKERVQRKERTPVNGERDILTVKGKNPDYEYRWVLDVPGRILRFQDGGWETVTDDLEIGQKAVDSPSDKVGSAITKHAGSNRMYVLMRILKEWFDEDQAAKQASVDAVEATMQEDLRQGRFPGSGSNQTGSYVPEGGGLNVESSRGRRQGR